MKYLLLIVSILIISYSGYGLTKCLQSFDTLTEYGKGYLTGSIILLIIGGTILLWTISKFKQKKVKQESK